MAFTFVFPQWCCDNSLSLLELSLFSHSNRSLDLTHQILKVQPKAITEPFGWKSYSQGLSLTLPLIKARLTNKMNHAPLFLKPQHFGETSQTSSVCSLYVHLTAENNNGSDFHTIFHRRKIKPKVLLCRKYHAKDASARLCSSFLSSASSPR